MRKQRIAKLEATKVLVQNWLDVLFERLLEHLSIDFSDELAEVDKLLRGGVIRQLPSLQFREQPWFDDTVFKRSSQESTNSQRVLLGEFSLPFELLHVYHPLKKEFGQFIVLRKVPDVLPFLLQIQSSELIPKSEQLSDCLLPLFVKSFEGAKSKLLHCHLHQQQIDIELESVLRVSFTVKEILSDVSQFFQRLHQQLPLALVLDEAALKRVDPGLYSLLFSGLAIDKS